jgi:hypothetical protein
MDEALSVFYKQFGREISEDRVRNLTRLELLNPRSSYNDFNKNDPMAQARSNSLNSDSSKL